MVVELGFLVLLGGAVLQANLGFFFQSYLVSPLDFLLRCLIHWNLQNGSVKPATKSKNSVLLSAWERGSEIGFPVSNRPTVNMTTEVRNKRNQHRELIVFCQICTEASL